MESSHEELGQVSLPENAQDPGAAREEPLLEPQTQHSASQNTAAAGPEEFVGRQGKSYVARRTVGKRAFRRMRSNARQARVRKRGRKKTNIFDISNEDRDHAKAFIHAIIGEKENLLNSSTDIQQEAQVYLFYVGESLRKVPESSMAILLPPESDATVSGLSRILKLLTGLCQALASKPRISLDGVALFLQEKHIIPVDCMSTDEKRKETLQGIFCLVGFVTMLYLPVWPPLGPLPQQDQLRIYSENVPCVRNLSQPIEKSARPIQTIRLGFGEIIPAREDSDTTLYVSNMNAATLLNVGKIDIKWVHTIGSHLDFDESNRLLMVFFLPSFCKLNSHSDETVLATIINDLQVNGNFLVETSRVSARDYMSEILRSYSLLFGDDGASRQLYRKRLKKKIKNIFGFRDSHLDFLCHLDDAKKTLAAEAQLQNRIQYSTKHDFPLLAPRLVRLQNFIAGQSPRGFWSLWRDKRDLNRWVTLWAATFLGLIGLGFAIIQIILGSLQVYYSKPSNTKAS
ncbi:hypothetical protein EG329_001240 [Mollisiaceae sp. DMI_Dod_QoI]|nr:hypothetical protein EG329_001240 [Helotiales sp. DMI_Dod_QoI]